MKVLINNINNLDETIKYNIKQHKISFLLSNGSSVATVDKIMRYLSFNPLYESISNIYVQETLNKIEENNKYNFLEVVQGDMETIIGFPINNFIERIRKWKSYTL